MALGTMRDAAHSSDGDTLPPALGMYDWQGVRSETGQHFKRHRDGVLNRYRILEAAHYNPKALDLTAIRLPADVVRIQEFVSQNTHEVWARQRIAQGWKWGENRDNRRKLHPDLIPYEELTDECKECVVMMVFPCLVRGASHLLVLVFFWASRRRRGVYLSPSGASFGPPMPPMGGKMYHLF